MVSHDSSDVCYDVCTVYRAGDQSSTLAGVCGSPSLSFEIPPCQKRLVKNNEKAVSQGGGQSKDPHQDLQ